MFSLLLLTAAWDAVGVGAYTPPPPPAPPIEFDYDPATFTGTKTDQKIDTSGNSQVYYMSVSPGSTVTCSTTGNNGDADLYVRFDDDPDANPNSVGNDCMSYSSNSNEVCTTSAAPSTAQQVKVKVHAWTAFSNLAVECTEYKLGSCLGPGAPCSSNCCNGCSGGPPSSRVCN